MSRDLLVKREMDSHLCEDLERNLIKLHSGKNKGKITDEAEDKVSLKTCEDYGKSNENSMESDLQRIFLITTAWRLDQSRKGSLLIYHLTECTNDYL